MFTNKEDYSKLSVKMIKQTCDLRRRVEGPRSRRGFQITLKDHPDVIVGATLSVSPAGTCRLSDGKSLRPEA